MKTPPVGSEGCRPQRSAAKAKNPKCVLKNKKNKKVIYGRTNERTHSFPVLLDAEFQWHENEKKKIPLQ
jgi:hypothetical protein